MKLIKYDAARVALAEASRVDDAKQIRDAATALETYARQIKDVDMEKWVAEIKLRASVRIGELSKALPTVPGKRTDKQPSPAAGLGSKTAALKAAGVTKQDASRCEALAGNSAVVENYLAAEASAGHTVTVDGALKAVARKAKAEKREARRQENRDKVATVPEPAAIVGLARFATIVIDPPWDWGDEGDVDQLGRARPDYATMSLADIAELPVGELADTDCHLYLWITNRSLPKGFGLMGQWGFRYITCLTWCKPFFGMGNYFRGSTEHLLFGVKGSQPLNCKDAGTWFAAPRPGGHGTKPDEAYAMIERASPGPYVELFARRRREGWKSWGEHDRTT